jgi:hypothetical protein
VDYWIFVTGSRGSPTPEEALKRRLHHGHWPVGTNTKGVQCLADGDHVLFYLAGKGNRAFVGQAELSAAPRPISEVAAGRDVGAENDEWNLPVELRNIDV